MRVVFRRYMIFCLSIVPFLLILFRVITGRMGADPAKEIVEFTGNWGFYFLLITLSVTPLKSYLQTRFLHFRWLQTHRRMLGLFCLFYVVLHALSFWFFILGNDIYQIQQQIFERPYILVSLPAFLLLIALGVTSISSIMRKMGSNWLRLHKSIYLIAILSCVHVWMQIRSSYAEALLFVGLTSMLLLLRIWRRYRA